MPSAPRRRRSTGLLIDLQDVRHQMTAAVFERRQMAALATPREWPRVVCAGQRSEHRSAISNQQSAISNQQSARIGRQTGAVSSASQTALLLTVRRNFLQAALSGEQPLCNIDRISLASCIRAAKHPGAFHRYSLRFTAPDYSLRLNADAQLVSRAREFKERLNAHGFVVSSLLAADFIVQPLFCSNSIL